MNTEYNKFLRAIKKCTGNISLCVEKDLQTMNTPMHDCISLKIIEDIIDNNKNNKFAIAIARSGATYALNNNPVSSFRGNYVDVDNGPDITMNLQPIYLKTFIVPVSYSNYSNFNSVIQSVYSHREYISIKDKVKFFNISKNIYQLDSLQKIITNSANHHPNIDPSFIYELLDEFNNLNPKYNISYLEFLELSFFRMETDEEMTNRIKFHLTIKNINDRESKFESKLFIKSCIQEMINNGDNIDEIKEYINALS